MAVKVQIEYAEMESIAAKLKTSSEAIQSSCTESNGALDALQGQWVSPAATQFFRQAGAMLERYRKLVEASHHLVDTTNTIAATLREIEEDAKSQFNWLRDLPDSGDSVAHAGSAVSQGTAHAKPAPETNAFWQNYVGRTSSDQIMRAQGCVAYVMDTTYVPWVSDASGISPGHGREWEARAAAWAQEHPEYGITIDDTPRPGAIATWATGSGGFGHVAKVESVNGDQFVISEASTWNSSGGGNAWGRWYGENDAINSSPKTRTINGTSGVRFIHFPWEETD